MKLAATLSSAGAILLFTAALIAFQGNSAQTGETTTNTQQSIESKGYEKAMFAGGLENVQKQTKAQKGDKTMMDALIPAVEAMQNSDTADVKELLLSAADAALKGAEDTVRMKANFGRARNYGEQSIGYADSGATSWSCMFAAFAEAI